jgi:hypothetical protein
VLLLSGCGSAAPSGSTTGNGAQAAAASAAQRQASEAKAPKGASPTLRAIYAEFPPPHPSPEVRSSAAAIAAGRRACGGRAPLQVEEEFMPVALAKGTLKADSPEGKMIARIRSFERHVSTDSSFAAGQLAADVYRATLGPSIGQFGYEGCVYSLALVVERELAPKGKGNWR